MQVLSSPASLAHALSTVAASPITPKACSGRTLSTRSVECYCHSQWGGWGGQGCGITLSTRSVECCCHSQWGEGGEDRAKEKEGFVFFLKKFCNNDHRVICKRRICLKKKRKLGS